MVEGKPVVSNAVRRATPFVPARRFFQNSGRPMPIGVTTPNPVTTTLLSDKTNLRIKIRESRPEIKEKEPAHGSGPSPFSLFAPEGQGGGGQGVQDIGLLQPAAAGGPQPETDHGRAGGIVRVRPDPDPHTPVFGHPQPDIVQVEPVDAMTGHLWDLA